MSQESMNTVHLNEYLKRMREGDKSARDELLNSVCARLEKLTRKMLKGFPDVKRWEETGDVLNTALLRLLRALEQVNPNSVREFYSLAAMQIRRELLDLARHYRGAHGIGANHASNANLQGGEKSAMEWNPPDLNSDNSDNLELWIAFHNAVEELPTQEREVVSLTFYHGWAQKDIAELFQVNTRTVRRWWSSACVRLHETLGGNIPDVSG